MTNTTLLQIYDFDALRAMGQATAYPPLPIEPNEERGPLMWLAADNKPPPKPDPQPKPAYEPLPTEVDTRKIKPGTTR